jgi:putative transposase
MNVKAAICYNVHMETRLSGHSVYRTEYHIVWIPKYRRRILNPGVKGYLRKLFPKILRSLPGCEIIEYNIQVDHIHMIMIIPPRYSVADVIGQIKAQSASGLRKKFSWLAKVYWKENIVWSPGYFVSTVGIDERSIIKYVQFQQSQDLGQAKLELF